MSLVVYRDGRLYADTKAWGGESSLPSPGSKNKIVYADDGAMIGVTSASLGEAKIVLAAYNDDSSKVDDGAFTALIVKPGVPGYFYWLDDHEMLGPFEEPYFAVGSGSKYALGALEVGATMADVFRAAAKHDYFTDSVFRTFDLAPKPARKRAKTSQ